MIPQAPLAGNNFERPLLMVKLTMPWMIATQFPRPCCRRLHTYWPCDRSLDTAPRTSNCVRCTLHATWAGHDSGVQSDVGSDEERSGLAQSRLVRATLVHLQFMKGHGLSS